LRLLVTGGAGYIGSVVAAQLLGAGHEVVVLDDLSTGHRAGVPGGAEFTVGDIRKDAAKVLADGVDAVLHFAARSLVGESVAYPDQYWSANLGGSVALLEAMREAGVRRIVFSSTAAVYGDPASVPIRETAPPLPSNPYGMTKVAVDTVLTEYARMHGMAAVSLRYFNVAGAYRDPGGQWLGERHSPETHLIPNVLAVAQRGDGPLRIFGDDYPTPDGTCVRDYIHVADLAQAHLLALEACAPGEHKIYNLGSGTGFSNREILAACRDVTGLDIPAQIAGRRAGDPAILVASSDRIRADLGWQPSRDLHAIVADAWAFAQAVRDGLD